MALFSLFNTKQSLQSSGVLKGFADRHSHILFGVDDGLGNLEESLAVLQYMEQQGVNELWCTPHIMEDVANTTNFLKERFNELKENYKGGIKLNLAAEYMLDTVFETRLKEKDLLTMEDDILLVETSTVAEPYNFIGSMQEIMRAGYRPLFAHPERYRFLAEKDFNKLYELGVRFQLNIGSLTGYYGEAVKKKAEYLLSKGMYWCCGSDCHKLKSIVHQHSLKVLSKNTIKLLQTEIKHFYK